VERLLEHLERLLGESGFLDEREPGTVLLRLRRLFFRTRLDQVEVNILRGFLSALERRLSTPERRPGQGGPSGSS
jgi:tRNA C32,U32 (ribose-2'-O)-methylase TrmJ